MNLNLNTSDNVAQLAHVGWGVALVMILSILGLPIWLSILIVVVFAGVKEYIEYRWGLWEARDSKADSIKDFIFWCIGIAIGMIVLLIH